MESILYCPICGCDHLEPLLTFSGIPVFVNLLADTEEEARSVVRGTQALTMCAHCGYVFNRDFEPEKMNYRPGYHAEQTYSSYFQRHMRDVLLFISSIESFKNKYVLEVGCGLGEFLREIAENYGAKKCFGVDPSTSAM